MCSILNHYTNNDLTNLSLLAHLISCDLRTALLGGTWLPVIECNTEGLSIVCNQDARSNLRSLHRLTCPSVRSYRGHWGLAPSHWSGRAAVLLSDPWQRRDPDPECLVVGGDASTRAEHHHHLPGRQLCQVGGGGRRAGRTHHSGQRGARLLQSHVCRNQVPYSSIGGQVQEGL